MLKFLARLRSSLAIFKKPGYNACFLLLDNLTWSFYINTFIVAGKGIQSPIGLAR